jgi:hypothetical protein
MHVASTPRLLLLLLSWLWRAVVAAGWAYVMGKRYMATGKVMPAGMVAGLR